MKLQQLLLPDWALFTTWCTTICLEEQTHTHPELLQTNFINLYCLFLTHIHQHLPFILCILSLSSFLFVSEETRKLCFSVSWSFYAYLVNRFTLIKKQLLEQMKTVQRVTAAVIQPLPLRAELAHSKLFCGPAHLTKSPSLVPASLPWRSCSTAVTPAGGSVWSCAASECLQSCCCIWCHSGLRAGCWSRDFPFHRLTCRCHSLSSCGTAGGLGGIYDTPPPPRFFFLLSSAALSPSSKHPLFSCVSG